MAGYSGLTQSLDVRGLGNGTKAGDMVEAHDMLSLHGMFKQLPQCFKHDALHHKS